jgi:hypothetical protein
MNEVIMKKQHEHSSDPECTHETTYELNHALVQLIQKTTSEFTHVIMNNIIAETNKMFDELSIDPNSKTAGATWQKGWGHNSKYYWYSNYQGKRKNKLVTYPNTDIRFNLIVTTTWHNEYAEYDYDRVTGRSIVRNQKENFNKVKVKVTLPNKTLTYTTSDMSMLLAEGDILDESTAIEDLDIKQSKPPRKKKAKTDSKIET